jgi:hypothetical protein
MPSATKGRNDLTSNLTFGSWDQALAGDPVLTAAMLDRLAITARLSTRTNSYRSALHSIGIGAPPQPRQTVSATRFSQIRDPDAPTPFEKSRLALNQCVVITVQHCARIARIDFCVN